LGDEEESSADRDTDPTELPEFPMMMMCLSNDRKLAKYSASDERMK